MNILVVDDDIPAVQGVVQIIPWRRLNITEVFRAYSLPDAMQKLKNNHVDILLTDIEMQNGTGFDLIQWCNLNNHDYAGIILSSFPYFEYAQRAISLGVFEYLLKPVEDDVLENAILRALLYLKKGAHLSNLRDQRVSHPIIERTKLYIAEHLSQDISRSDVASFVGLSPEYLSTFFKKETDSTLSDYIKNERIDLARKLLKQTNLPISMISCNVGYESVSYFSQVFKQVTELTPREYRAIEQVSSKVIPLNS